jgi:acetyl esterase/lipase
MLNSPRGDRATHVMRRALQLLVAGAVAAIIAGCGAVVFSVANAPALVGPFERTAGIAYAPGPRHALDVYAPKVARGAPVVVFWYGGGWTRGHRGSYRFVGAALAEAGYVVVVPDYRLYPDVVFPAFVDDGALAVAWATRHAAEFGGDPRKVFLMGHSAGAHLAAMLATSPQRLRDAGVDPAAIRGLIGLSGPYELTPNSAELHRIFAAPYVPQDWQPAERVTEATPPTLLLHGGADNVVWPSHAERFAAALRAHGVPVTLEIYPGRKHADTVGALALAARGRLPALASIREFIDARSGP